MSHTYKVIRKYCDMEHPDHNKVIDRGLTHEDAQEHCSREDTHEKGVWMDVYTEELSDVEFRSKRQPSLMDKLCMLQGDLD